MLRALHREAGLTLIEVLIAMSTGLVVAAAAFTLLSMSLHLYTRTSERVDAGQSARLAMATIVSELESSCVAPSLSGVQSGGALPNADGSHLVFVSQPNSVVTPKPILHDVALVGGALTDSSYTSSGPATGPWTFPSPPTSQRVLARNVTQIASTPVFQYFAYGSDGEIDDGSNGTAASPLDPGSTLSPGDAATVAEVVISFSAGPNSANASINDAGANVTSSVVLRFTPNSGTGASQPCH